MTDTHKELSILDTLKLALEALNTWCKGFPDLVSDEDRKSIAAIKTVLEKQSATQLKPLTDEQREEIAKGWRGRNWTLGDIIDAVEAAHGIVGDTNE